jgi:methionine-gamma-lyase
MSPALETLAVHAARPEGADGFGAHVPPIYQTSTFVLPGAEAGARAFAGEEGSRAHVYSRLGNPTVEALETALARLEGCGGPPAQALAFGSGMAAISTLFLGAAAGRRIVAQRALYGCTAELLHGQAAEMGIEVTWVDPTDLGCIRAALRRDPAPALVYLESPANPTLTLCDVAAIAEMAHERGARVAVDNTFATPYHQRPLALGADVVVHSTTKYVGGHGTVLGGAVVTRDPELHAALAGWRKNLGGIASPFDAWLLLNGIRTLALRMERHAASGQVVAEWLEAHPKVSRVWYPGLASHPQHALALRQMENGFGGMVAFELEGGYGAGVRLMDSVRLCSLAVSLGTVDTLIQHPASMTHSVMEPEERERAGIGEGLIRLSVGIEAVDDIVGDLARALQRC